MIESSCLTQLWDSESKTLYCPLCGSCNRGRLPKINNHVPLVLTHSPKYSTCHGTNSSGLRPVALLTLRRACRERREQSTLKRNMFVCFPTFIQCSTLELYSAEIFHLAASGCWVCPAPAFILVSIIIWCRWGKKKKKQLVILTFVTKPWNGQTVQSFISAMLYCHRGLL